MAKKKKVEAVGSLKDVLRDSAIKAYCEADIPTTKDMLRVVGIPLKNCLPLQYLLGVDVIPLERNIKIIGPPGGGKSQFAWWMNSQLIPYNPTVIWIETENKTSPNQLVSIIRYFDAKGEEVFERMVVPAPGKNLEDVLHKMAFFAQEINKAGVTDTPVVILVDSMSYVTSADSTATVEKDGLADTGYVHAHNANQATEQLKAFVPKYVRGHPILLVTVHHQKDNVGDSGYGPTANTGSGGGKHFDFASTFTLQITKSDKKPEERQKATRIVHWMKNVKNSLGIDKRSIEYEVVTTYQKDPDNPEAPPKQVIYYDWDKALIKLLSTEKALPYVSKDDLESVLGLRVSGAFAYAKRFDMKAEDKVSKAELGAMIHSDEALVKELQQLLHIDNHIPLAPGLFKASKPPAKGPKVTKR